MDKTNDLKNQIANLSNESLLEIISDKSKMYSDEAIAIARENLQLRGISEIKESNQTKTKVQYANSEINTQTSSKIYRGVRGWLALFVFQLTISCLIGLLRISAESQFAVVSISKFWLPFGLFFYSVGLIIVLCLGKYKARIAPLLVKIYLVGMLFSNLLFLSLAIFWAKDIPFLVTKNVYLSADIFILSELLALLIGGKFFTFEPNIAQSFLLFLYVVIWFLYFTFSKRVKTTYYQPDYDVRLY